MEQNMILTLRTLSFDETGSGQREEITLPENGVIHVNTKGIPVYKKIG